MPRNFRATDWEELKSILDKELLELKAPQEINSKEDLINALNRLEAVIMRMIDKVILRKKPSPCVKHWWTKELETARKKVRKLGQ